MQNYYSLRMKLNDVIEDIDKEQTILENIRRCKNLVGKQFKVIFWHEGLTKKECEEFVERNEHLLFHVNTKITKGFHETAWFIIDSKNEKCNSRYRCESDILSGIVEYIKIVQFILKKQTQE